jgi:hypothetical protein
VSREGHEFCCPRRVIRTQLYKIHNFSKNSSSFDTLLLKPPQAVSIQLNKRKTRELVLGNGDIHSPLNSLILFCFRVISRRSSQLCNSTNSQRRRSAFAAMTPKTRLFESYASKTALNTDHLELTAFRCRCYYYSLKTW